MISMLKKIGLIVGILTPIITASYIVGYKQGEKDLEVVNTFKSAEIPKLLSNLKNISNELQERYEMKNQLTKCYQDSTDKDKILLSMNSTITILQEDLEEKISEIKNIQDILSKYVDYKDEVFALSRGEAKIVIKGLLTVGVGSIYYIVNSSDITINGKTQHMTAGEEKTLQVGNKKCTLTVLKITENHINFAVSYN